jgi:hypothetical protein
MVYQTKAKTCANINGREQLLEISLKKWCQIFRNKNLISFVKPLLFHFPSGLCILDNLALNIFSILLTMFVRRISEKFYSFAKKNIFKFSWIFTWLGPIFSVWTVTLEKGLSDTLETWYLTALIIMKMQRCRKVF